MSISPIGSTNRFFLSWSWGDWTQFNMTQSKVGSRSKGGGLLTLSVFPPQGQPANISPDTKWILRQRESGTGPSFNCSPGQWMGKCLSAQPFWSSSRKLTPREGNYSHYRPKSFWDQHPFYYHLLHKHRDLLTLWSSYWALPWGISNKTERKMSILKDHRYFYNLLLKWRENETK